MFLNKTYCPDEFKEEKVALNGLYEIKTIKNQHPHAFNFSDDNELERNQDLHCKEVFRKGNILYKTDTPNIEELIEVMIKYTYGNSEGLNLDSSVKDKTTMKGGTICPSKEVCFMYKNKTFILYGRYIFGYDKPYIEFKSEDYNKINNKDQDDDSEDDEGWADTDEDSEDDKDSADTDEDSEDYEEPKDKEPSLSEKIIILPTISYKDTDTDYLSDYNYSFKIIDSETNILEAFGLYR